MKKILLFFTLVILYANCAYGILIEGNVSMNDKVPLQFYGSWKVESVCTRTTNKELFESRSTDIWTLTRDGETVTLSNPLSGASANINVNAVKGKTVKFEKKSILPFEESIETPILTIRDDNFVGVDKIVIRTMEKGKLIREDYVEYQIRGTKISGMAALSIFGMQRGE